MLFKLFYIKGFHSSHKGKINEIFTPINKYFISNLENISVNILLISEYLQKLPPKRWPLIASACNKEKNSWDCFFLSNMRILFYVDVYGKQVRSVMEYFMVPLLVITSILAIIGTIYNKRTANAPGFYIGGAFTVCIVAVTLLSLYDLFVGIQ